MNYRAAVHRKIEEAVPSFEVSDSLRQFLPPTTNYTMGNTTTWFKVDLRIKDAIEEEEAKITTKLPRQPGSSRSI